MNKKQFFILIISILFTLPIGIKAQNQKIKIPGNSISLKAAFDQIEKQTGLSVDYDAKTIDVKKLISISSQSIALKDLMTLLLNDTQCNYIINKSHIIISYSSENPKGNNSGNMGVSKKITGLVTDEKGEPIIGASVVLKGSNTGTITSIDGIFSLEVPDQSEILISYIGYKQTVLKIGKSDNYKIVLEEDSKTLDEVVVIGYGSMKKKDLTGSVVSANISAFKESPNVSLMQSLQGSVPGLNVGQVNSAGETPSFSIRGQNSFSAGNSAPLLVVDGIIYKGNINDLNPSDIKSVDILKDASSAAIYGSRAANGVILVTTLEGEAKSAKPVITYSTSYSTQDPVNTLIPLNREQWIKRVKDAVWDRAYTEASGYKEDNPSFNVESVWVANEIKEGYANGIDYNWLDAATQTGHTKNDYISISGKNQGSMYHISLGVTDQLGYIMNDKFKRYTGKINLENTITKWLKIGVQTNATFGDYSGMTPTMSNIMRMSPLALPRDSTGNLIKVPMGQNVPNPFQPIETSDVNKKMSLMGNLYSDIDIPFIKGLKYRINYSHNYRTSRRFQSDPNGANYQGAASKYNDCQYDWTLDNLLTYDRTFNVDHKVQITLVSGREESEFESTNAGNSVFSNLDLGYNNLSVGSNPTVSSTAWNETSLYYMGRAHYGYKGRYLGTFTVRRDGFSGFSETKKFAIFPSGALAWVVSEEKFMQKKPLGIDYLKFRVSYGATGNRTAGRYATLSQVSAAASNGYMYGDGSSVTVGQYVTSISNNDLQWETTLGTNLGMDFGLLNNRISGNIELYDSNTSNILYNRNLPYASGFTSVTSNIGQINNKGIEFSINTTNIKTKDFTWDMNFNFSLNRNKILSIVGKWNDANGDGIEDDQVSNSLFINQPLNVIYGYKIIGIYQIGDEIPSGYKVGEYKVEDVTGEGLITSEDKQILGYKDPSYRFSIGNTFKYKNFSLFVFINSVQGGKDRYMSYNDPGSSWGYSDASTNSNAVAWNYWTPTNTNARYSNLYYPTPNGVYQYQQRSFVRLQNISFSYQFDKNFLKKLGILNLKAYVSGQNLLTWTKWDGWDPETGEGLTMSGSPVLKSFTAGLDISF